MNKEQKKLENVPSGLGEIGPKHFTEDEFEMIVGVFEKLAEWSKCNPAMGEKLVQEDRLKTDTSGDLEGKDL